MRLVDADKLPEVNSIERTDERGVFVCSWIPAEAIWNAPTVEAIPIEWIKKWHEEEDRRLGDGWTHIEHPHSHIRMIEDWRKENEQRQDR